MNRKKLIDLCVEPGTYGVPNPAVEYSEKNYRYLRITDITDEGFLSDSDKKSVEGDNLEKYLLSKNDIVFARTGNSTGRSFFYEEKYGDLVYAGFLIKFKIDEKKINPKYIKYYTISPQYRRWINNFQTGSTRGNMNAQSFASMEICYPDRKTQDKIVDILDAITNKIEINNKIKCELEMAAKILFDYWFLQYDFPDSKGKPYNSSGGKMVWSPELRRKIPYGWGVDVVGKHTDIIRGISYSSEDLEGEGVPMINLNSFNTDASYKEEGLKTYSGKYNSDRKIAPYDLLICATQQTAIDLEGDTDVIGKSMIVPDIFGETDVVSSMDLIKLMPDEKYGKYYLNRLINTKFFHKYITGFVNGTKIKHLDIKGLMDYKCEVPEHSILEEFNVQMEQIEVQKSVLIAENQKLMESRRFLLPLLLTGNIDVNL